MHSLTVTIRAKASLAGAQTIYSGHYPVDAIKECWGYLDSDAASAGTNPTLNIKAQISPDGGTTWFDVASGAFTQVTTVASKQLLGALTAIGGGLFRFAMTIGGTVTPTFSFGLWLTMKTEN